MKKNRIVISGWQLLIGILVIVLIFSLLAPINTRSDRDYLMAFSSGEDYAEGKNGGGGVYQYRDDSGSVPPSPGDQEQPSEESKSSVPEIQGSRPGFVIDTERLRSWILPSAYAQDHKLGDRYLVRSGECTLQVEKYKEATDKLAAIAERYGGMVSDSESHREQDDSTGGSVTLRVPSASFVRAWADVLNTGKVLEEKVTTQDVSQNYLSNLSKLKTLMSEQAALQNMLDEALRVQRARGLGEGYKILLDTQQRLFEINEKLGITEDALNALADQITRSTIHVYITEKNELPAQVKEEFSWNVGTTAATAYRDLLVFLRDRLNGLVYFLITCWTWLIPLALLFLIGRWFYYRILIPRGFVMPPLVRVRVAPQPTGSGDIKPED